MKTFDIYHKFLSHTMKDKRKDSACKASQQTQVSPSTKHALVFLRWEKFHPGSDGDLTEQPLVSSVLKKCTDIDKNPVYIVVFGMVSSHGDIMLP